MAIRRSFIANDDLNSRINELETQRTLLRLNRDELNKLQKQLAKGDFSVMPRVKELFDLVDEKKQWIARNLPIIRSQMAS